MDDRAYESFWERFVSDGAVVDHWAGWGELWESTAADYLALLVPVAGTPLAGLVADIQKEIAIPLVDLVPQESLHITVYEIGFRDGIDPEELSGILERARAICRSTKPFVVRVASGNSFPDAAFLEVADPGPLCRLREALERAVPWAAKGREYVPHVSIGYYNRAGSNHEVAEALGRLRGLVVGDLPVDDIELVACRKPNRCYVWRSEAVLPLGGC